MRHWADFGLGDSVELMLRGIPRAVRDEVACLSKGYSVASIKKNQGKRIKI